MGNDRDIIEQIRAGLAPHGIILRGILHFYGDGPALSAGGRAKTVVLLGNVGGSIWPAFEAWRALNPGVSNPLDAWSMAVIGPTAEEFHATAWFPSEKPWQPFQQWAMRTEGLKASPLGILIHPHYGLWHGYRGALGFADRIGEPTTPFVDHPCDDCVDKTCLAGCPVGAVMPASFDVVGCRAHIQAPEGQAGCMLNGCLARNACPVGADYRYPETQLRFHMARLV